MIFMFAPDTLGSHGKVQLHVARYLQTLLKTHPGIPATLKDLYIWHIVHPSPPPDFYCSSLFVCLFVFCSGFELAGALFRCSIISYYIRSYHIISYYIVLYNYYIILHHITYY